MSSYKDEKLEQAVSALKLEFKPARIFLFGSRATGTAGDDSDYDFVIVLNEPLPSQLETIRRARRLLATLNIPADVFVYSEDEFEIRRHEFSTIPEVAYATGREIDLNE